MSEPTSAYRFAVNVTPKPGILDPQGKAVERSLPHLGIAGVSEVRVGRRVELVVTATDAGAVARIRDGLAARRTVTATLLNYRKDGTAFGNQLSVSPVFDGDGELVSFVGVQTDVTERVRVEREREAAFAAEQAARQEAELARAVAEQARCDAERAQAESERAQERLALIDTIGAASAVPA